jgi:NADPH-dependent ferric siderophore reductase
MIRVVAGGEGFAAFTMNDYSDRYVKLFFAPSGSALVPPYDLAEIRATLPQDQWPVVRTYTVRWVDVQNQRLAIDFVVHGDEGIAGPWAASAQPGDLLVLSNPGGGYTPDPEADWHLFIGDESALPAIGAGLEALDEAATGLAIIEVSDADGIQEVTAPAGIDLRWIITGEQTLSGALVDAPWPAGDPQVFAHGEREAMKGLRAVFADRGVDRARLSLSGYWARGRTEDRFQAEKREPIGRILD